MTPSAFHSRRADRRGNTLVLVTAILVLLVIIATAYISRAQGGRVIAAAEVAVTSRLAVRSAVCNRRMNDPRIIRMRR